MNEKVFADAAAMYPAEGAMLAVLRLHRQRDALLRACKLALPIVAAMCNALGETCGEDDAAALFALQDSIASAEDVHRG